MGNSPLPIHLLLKKLEATSFKGFSRSPSLNEEGIKCDCAGLITLILELQHISINELPQTPKAKDYFDWILSDKSICKDSIHQLDRFDTLVWKKENPPKQGDTGHLLILLRRPYKLSDNKYELTVLEVNRFQGLVRRSLNITTHKDGRLKGISWHPEKSKVKETQIIGASLFKSPTCLSCQLVNPLCQCSLYPESKPIAPAITILRHPTERKHPLGSVQLLESYFMKLHVEEGEVFPKRSGVLLYPATENQSKDTSGEGSTITTISEDTPLILIDATWKKSVRILKSNPWLLNLPTFHLQGLESRYFLRKQKGDHHLSSLESFCYSWMKLYPHDQSVAHHSNALLNLFEDFIERRKAYYEEETLSEYYCDNH